MLFSPQKWFCNTCGKEKFSVLEPSKFLGFSCCSLECVREIRWRQTLSIMGKEYTERNKEND